MRLCVIPARGGSKRIPRKNIRIFCGQPMIAYSIHAARTAGVFDHIVVSTDDEEIAAMSRQLGAQTPFVRPAELADDHTITSAVVAHAIRWFEAADEPPEFVCCLYPTAPFVRSADLRNGLARLAASDKLLAFSATSFPFPVQRAFYLDQDGAPNMFHPEHYLTRSQDLEPAYHDAGQFYWGRPEGFLSDHVIFSPISIPILLPRHLVQDIDTLEDWERAELMYRASQSVRQAQR